ncbi:MAG: hypothetical protein Q4D38_14015 [Planctomycetia bacterium]|nr:hypothetical protein [Planctomycetia bacterium]
MNINKLSNIQGVRNTNAIGSKSAETKPLAENTAAAPQRDVVDVANTPEAGTAEDVTFSGVKVDKVRIDLVARIQKEIAAGTYDTDEKLEIALERMLNGSN